MADGGARKRKWDMPAPSGAPPAAAPPAAGTPLDAFAVAQARAQAIAAAAAFAARLGTPGAAPAAPSAAAALAEGVAQAFDLNELEPLARGALTKRPVHEEVMRKTGCVLHTRGRYWPPGAVRGPGDEAALHIWISPGASVQQESLEAQRGAVASAIAMLREQAAAAAAPRARAPAPSYAAAPQAPVPPPVVAAPPPAALTTRLPLGFDATCDPAFDAPARLRGPGGAYLAHVARQTGASVELVGAGAGGSAESAEPLALLVRAPHAAAMAAACQLAGSLLATVCADWARAHPEAAPPPMPPMPVVPPPVVPVPMMPPGGAYAAAMPAYGYAPPHAPYAAAGSVPPYGAALPGGYAPHPPPYAPPPYGYAPVPPPGPPPPAAYKSVPPPASVVAGAQVLAGDDAAPQPQATPAAPAPQPRRFREFKEAPPPPAPPAAAEAPPPPPSLAALGANGDGEQDAP